MPIRRHNRQLKMSSIDSNLVLIHRIQLKFFPHYFSKLLLLPIYSLCMNLNKMVLIIYWRSNNFYSLNPQNFYSLKNIELWAFGIVVTGMCILECPGSSSGSFPKSSFLLMCLAATAFLKIWVFRTQTEDLHWIRSSCFSLASLPPPWASRQSTSGYRFSFQSPCLQTHRNKKFKTKQKTKAKFVCIVLSLSFKIF